jgi:hypothetical protein
MPGLLLAVFIGFIGYGTKLFINSPLADPLLVALLFGILGRAALGNNRKFKPGDFSQRQQYFLWDCTYFKNG